MRENILRSREEQLVTVADTLDSRLKSLEEPFVSLAGYPPTVRLLFITAVPVVIIIPSVPWPPTP